MRRRATDGRWTAEQAREVLDAWEASGQSGAAYGRSIGVVAQRLFWWRRRLGRHGERGGGETTLVPVTVRGSLAVAGSAAVVVTTAGGSRIEVHEVDATTASWS